MERLRIVAMAITRAVSDGSTYPYTTSAQLLEATCDKIKPFGGERMQGGSNVMAVKSSSFPSEACSRR